MAQLNQIKSIEDNIDLKKIDYYIPTENDEVLKPGVIKIVKALVTKWENIPESNLILKELKGGITNKLWKCKVDSASVLVRIYGNNTNIIIDRLKELRCFNSISKLGFAPTLYGRFNNGYVYDYINGRSLDKREMSLQQFVPKIARQLAKFHSMQVVGENQNPLLLKTLRNWLEKAPTFENVEKQKRFAEFKKEVNFDHFSKELDSLEKVLMATKSPVVFAHNDLLSGNVVTTTTNEIQFIDYEYCGYNYRGFDIANHFFEFCGFECELDLYPTESTQREFLKNYLHEYTKIEPTEEQVSAAYIEVQIFVLASHLWWGFWAFLQARYSDIDFDFFDYGLMRVRLYSKHKNYLFEKKFLKWIEN